MLSEEIKIQYIGGPTALLEFGGLRFLTDPTFDPKGSAYPTAIYTLHKLSAPTAGIKQIGKINFVLLSHDHHFDNLDHAGRLLLVYVDRVYTTLEGARRLGHNATGLGVWETVEVPTRDNRILQITGTPCRHGPVNGDRGPVTGFVLRLKGEDDGVYISGDTVFYEGVEAVAERFHIGKVILFMGAAVVPEVGKDLLTMNAEDAVRVAETFEHAKITPLHFEGWAHFTESRKQIEDKLSEAGLCGRLQWAEPFISSR